jgi:hypothetical protein
MRKTPISRLVSGKLRLSFIKVPCLFIAFFTAFTCIPSQSQAQFDVILGTHNIPIAKFAYTRNGVHTLDTAGNQATVPTNDEINVDSIVVVDGTDSINLQFIDIEAAVIANNNFTSSVSGVGVYESGTEILASDSAAWEAAMNKVVTNRNIINYLFYDGSSNVPSGADFDVLWTRGLLPTDYLAVSERDGNTFFTLTPLDSTGNTISGARSLRFGNTAGAISPNGNDEYDWNTSFASAGRSPSQPQYMSVIRVDLFNANVNIYGLRIDNNGNADVKFYGLSDSTFLDNPVNPNVSGLSGNIFLDSNGLTDGLVRGQLIDTAGGLQLYVSLVKNNAVDSTIPVNEDGSYLFLGIDTGVYNVVLTTNPMGSTTPNLPSGWVNMGENDGAGVGSDGNPNGTSPAVTVTDSLETQINFGIQRRPNGDNKSFTLNPSPVINEVRPLLASDGMGRLTGTDPEDGVYSGNFPFTITDTTGMNGNVLFFDDNGNGSYDAGEELEPSDTVLVGDSTKLSVRFSSPNTTDFVFEYSPLDSGRLADSTPPTFSANWADPLPVEWLSFEAFQMDNGSIQLMWATASEENSDKFEVQRSSGTKDWNTIGIVDGQGNSASITRYVFEDQNPAAVNLYRIKQIDFDGSTSYSRIVLVDISNSMDDVNIFPTPVKTMLYVNGLIEVNTDERIEVMNQEGNVVIESTINQATPSVDVSGLPAGIYFIRIQGTTKRFIKI